MTIGTRIGLAIGALLVTVLVVYYGFFTNPGLDGVASDSLPIERALDPALTPDSADRLDATSALREHAASGPVDRLAEHGPTSTPPGIGAVEGTIEAPARETMLANRAARYEFDDAPLQARRPEDADSGKGDPPPAAVAPAVAETASAHPPPSDEAVSREEPAARETDSSARSLWVLHTVREGETLSSIARDWFGDARKWDLITEMNPGLEPRDLRVGHSLRLPPRDAGRPTTPASATLYRVRPGDSLSTIAGEVYGDQNAWPRLHDANRALIGPDPGALKVGTELRVPR